jgi:hypothetical protein
MDTPNSTRRWYSALFAGVVVLLPAVASGDAGATSDPEPVMMVTTSAMLVLPQADGDDFAGTSIGMRAVFGYAVTPIISVIGSVDYVFVNEKEEVVSDQVSISFYSISAGARATMQRPGVRPFGELMLGRSTASVSSPRDDSTDSDLGFRLGGGIIYDLGPALVASAQLSYSTVEIEGADLDALAFEGGLGWMF